MCAERVLYKTLRGSLRLGARVAPRNVAALRFITDSKVPSVFLHPEVSLETETIDTADGALQLEWIIPEDIAEDAGSDGGSTRASGSVESDECERFGFCGGTPSSRRSNWCSRCMDWSRRDVRKRRFRRVILYMHGGAYVLCTPGSLRGCTSPISRAAGAAVCVPEYRRPPEHSIEAAVQDGLVAYKHLLRTYPDAEIFLGGESAGAGLAASMLIAMRDGGLPFPRGAMLMSPWSDLSGDGAGAGLRHASLDGEGARKDYLPLDLVSFLAEKARGDLPPDRVPASPMYADGSLAHLPPIFVLYGKSEVLCAQIERFCQSWSQKGARVKQHGVVGGVHAPVLFHFCHAPSRAALKELTAFFDSDFVEGV